MNVSLPGVRFGGASSHILQRSDRFLDGQLELQALGASIERLRRAVTDTVTRATHRGHRNGG